MGWKRLGILSAWLLAGCLAQGAEPLFFQALDPVRPDETLLLYGADMSSGATAEGLRLADAPVTGPQRDRDDAPVGKSQALEILQQTAQSAKVLIPGKWKAGVFAVRVINRDGATSAWNFVNRPQLWWQMSGADGRLNPGGELRVFGKNFGRHARLWLVASDGTAHELTVRTARNYDVLATVPGDLAAGAYRLWAHNGFGGRAGFGAPLTVEVAAADEWPAEIHDVTEYGAKGNGEADDTAAIRRALAWAGGHGGGVVYLPRGTYCVTGKLVLPPRTTLRGESRESVWIKVPTKTPPFEAVFAGEGYFRIENLSVIAQPVRRIVASPDLSGTYSEGYARWAPTEVGSGHIALNNLRLQHLFFRSRLNEKDPRRVISEGPSAVAINGSDVEIADCVIVASGMPIQLAGARRDRVVRNELGTGRSGWFGFWNFEDGLFEGNTIIGRDLEGSYGAVQLTAFHVMFRANVWRDAYGCEREALTFDTPSLPAWIGLATVEGREMKKLDPAPEKWLEWNNAAASTWAAVVMSGRGAGQLSPVKRRESAGVELTESFKVAPDVRSVMAVAACKSQVLVVDNTISDSSVGVQLYSMSHEFVIANNHFTRTGGTYAHGRDYLDENRQRKISYAYFNQWLDNTFEEGLVYDQGPWPYGYVGYTADRSAVYPDTIPAIGNRFVGNRLLGGTRMGATTWIQAPFPGADHYVPVASDAIFENNMIQNVPAEIRVDPRHAATLVRGNQFGSPTR